MKAVNSVGEKECTLALNFGGAADKTYFAWEYRGSLGRLLTIENRLSCLRCNKPSKGRHPARKNTTALGVLEWSLSSF